MKSYFKLLIVVVVIGFLNSCGSTQMIGTWKNPDAPTMDIKKVIVLAITDNLSARSTFEDQTVKVLKARGIEAGKSLEYFPPKYIPTEDDKSNILKELHAKGFDIIITMSLLDVNEESH